MPSAKDIKELRGRTGAGILDCKKALAACEDDMEKAIDWLRTKGLAAAAKKAGRVASEGVVGSYIHAGGKIGVLVEVNCETDFVSRTEQFKALVHEIAMQVAAYSPKYVSVDEISADELQREREVQRTRVIEEGKPEHIADRIVEGRLKKYYKEICLLDQEYFRDDSKTVADVISEAVSTIGEKIKVRRFVRLVMGEGLKKREDDFVSEVMQQAGRSS